MYLIWNKKKASLSIELDLCRKKEEDMQNQIKEAIFSARLAAEHANRNKQYSCRDNIKFFTFQKQCVLLNQQKKTKERLCRFFTSD